MADRGVVPGTFSKSPNTFSHPQHSSPTSHHQYTKRRPSGDILGAHLVQERTHSPPPASSDIHLSSPGTLLSRLGPPRASGLDDADVEDVLPAKSLLDRIAKVEDLSDTHLPLTCRTLFSQPSPGYPEISHSFPDAERGADVGAIDRAMVNDHEQNEAMRVDTHEPGELPANSPIANSQSATVMEGSTPTTPTPVSAPHLGGHYLDITIPGDNTDLTPSSIIEVGVNPEDHQPLSSASETIVDPILDNSLRDSDADMEIQSSNIASKDSDADHRKSIVPASSPGPPPQSQNLSPQDTLRHVKEAPPLNWAEPPNLTVQSRNLIEPLVFQNAQRRETFKDINLEHLKDRIRDVLTEGVCFDLWGKAKILGDQMAERERQLDDAQTNGSHTDYSPITRRAIETPQDLVMLYDTVTVATPDPPSTSEPLASSSVSMPPISRARPPVAPRAMLREKSALAVRDTVSTNPAAGATRDISPIVTNLLDKGKGKAVDNYGGIRRPSIDWNIRKLRENDFLMAKPIATSHPNTIIDSDSTVFMPMDGISPITPTAHRTLLRYSPSLDSDHPYTDPTSTSPQPGSRSPRDFRNSPRQYSTHSIRDTSRSVSRSRSPPHLRRPPSSRLPLSRSRSRSPTPPRRHRLPYITNYARALAAKTANIQHPTPPPAEVDPYTEHKLPDPTPLLARSPSPTSSVAPAPTMPVPGLWSAAGGRDSADIVEMKFEIDADTALRWNISDLTNSKYVEPPDVSLHLLCLPFSEVASVHQTIDFASATAEAVAKSMWEIPTRWPPQGKLIVDINESQKWGRSWLPRHLDSSAPPINLSGHVRKGLNIVRLIQLDGLTEYMFLLHASPSAPRIKLDLTSLRSRNIDAGSVFDIEASMSYT